MARTQSKGNGGWQTIDGAMGDGFIINADLRGSSLVFGRTMRNICNTRVAIRSYLKCCRHSNYELDAPEMRQPVLSPPLFCLDSFVQRANDVIIQFSNLVFPLISFAGEKIVNSLIEFE